MTDKIIFNRAAAPIESITVTLDRTVFESTLAAVREDCSTFSETYKVWTQFGRDLDAQE